MHSLRKKICRAVQEVDFTARAFLRLGRVVGTVRPYRIVTNLGVRTASVDTELLERFIFFCATTETHGMTDTEMHLFMAKFSTETNTGIDEIDRAFIFDKLSDEILKLIEEIETTDIDVTAEYRIDSEKNRIKDGLC